MHFEFLTEDQSGKKALEVLLPKILNSDTDTYRIHSYKGLGRIPNNLRPHTGAEKRVLLDQLPRLLRGFGKTFARYSQSCQPVVIVICDLDSNEKTPFLEELTAVLQSCEPQPTTKFYLAIEETEAWYLGDLKAIIEAYPNANRNILRDYDNDSICGTWELLADAVYSGGSVALSNQGWKAVGLEKTKWAETICPHMDVENNSSPSFNEFKSGVRSHCDS